MTAFRVTAFLVTALTAAGCKGELALVSDAGIDARVPATDAGPPVDGRVAGDASPDLLVDAGRADAGSASDAGTSGPCGSVTCDRGQRCEAGACVCADGFMRSGAECVPIAAGDPAGRSEAEVCAAWRDGHVVDAPSPFTADGMCGVGVLAPAAYGDVLRRANLFRWLAGLGPVTENLSQRAAMQECAVMMSAAGDLEHRPSADWPCYTAAGASAARTSNLSLLFSGGPAEAIDQFMRDCSRPPCSTFVGHRRWQIYYGLGAIGIGSARVEGATFLATCIGIANGGGVSEREWVAYPNPGPAPVETTDRLWSFHPGRSGFRISGGEVSVTRVSDGVALPVTASSSGASGLPPGALVWSLDGWVAEVGETYRVHVGGLSGGDVTYDVRVVACET